MLELRNGKYYNVPDGLGSQAGRLGFSSPKVGMGDTYQPFTEPEKPWWNFLVDNPIMWLLEKFNRPQQAIFSYVHEAMTPGKEISPGKAAWESFTKGGGARFADIMDEMGLQGQAGKFDPLDILGVAGEVLLDPINLLGVGAVGKFGKARMLPKFLKGVDMAAVETKAMPKLVSMLGSEQKATSALQKMRSAGVAMPGEFEAKVAQEAARLVGPDAFSHYLNIGWGKNRVSVPGSQKVLEPFVKSGRYVRDRFRGALSTQPRSYTEAMPQALVNVIARHKAGVNQQFALWAKRLPKEWTKERLATAVEKGIRPGVEAGEAVQEAYELGVWLSDYLPQLEEMKGVMTAKYAGRKAEIPIGLEDTLPPDAISALKGGFPRGLGKEGVDIPNLKGLVDEIYKAETFSVSGTKVGKVGDFIRTPELQKQFNDVLDIDVTIKQKMTGDTAGFLAVTFPWEGKPKITGITLSAAKLSRNPDEIGHVFIHEIAHAQQVQQGKITGKISSKFRAALEKEADATADYTFADLLDTQGLDPNSDDAINYFIHALHPDVRAYKAKHDIRWRGKGGQFQALEARHPSQLMRKVEGNIQGINEWGRETGDFMFHPKGELLKFYKKSGRDIRESIERDVRRYIEGGAIKDVVKVRMAPNINELEGFIKSIDPDLTKTFGLNLDMSAGRSASRFPAGEVEIGLKGASNSEAKGIILHELGHLQEDVEGFISSKAIDLMETDLALAREVEAVYRAVKMAPQYGVEVDDIMAFTNKNTVKKFYELYPEYKKAKVMGAISETMASLGTKLGVPVEVLLKDAGHFKTFDQFFVDDWAQGMAMRVGRHTQATAVSEMMQMTMDARNELGEGRWARPIADAPADWVRIIDDMPASLQKRLTPEFVNQLDNTAFDPEMATALTKGLKMMYDPKARNEALGVLRKGLSWVRASTILPFAGYHVANVVGNRWGRYLMGVVDVQYDVMAGQIRLAIKKGDMAGLKKMNFTLGGKKLTGEQIMHHAFFNDVMAGGSMTAEVAGYGRFGAKPMDIGETMKFKDAINPFGRKQLGAKLATNLEDHDRLAGFIGRLNKGDDFSVAAAAVDKHLFRYSDLTDIEAGTKSMPGIKDATLFYTWYRKNIGLTLQKMWEYPGRMSAPIKVRNALNGIYGDPDSDYAVPSYLKDQFYFYLGKDAEGKPKFLDPEKYLPPLSASKFFGGGLKGMGREAIGMLIPPLKAGAEAGFGKEAFTGRDLEGVPGQKQAMFGKEIAPAWAYAAKNIRMLNTINRTLFPAAEGPEGRVRAGVPGARPKGALGKAFRREYIGIKLQTTDVQRNRYFEAVSPGGRINSDLDKIASKMAGKTSPLQRESFIKARTELLWEKAEVIRQMIEDGTDPFTGKPMDWQPPMPAPGTRKGHSMRDLYTEMYGTLRGLYFGEPPIPGVLLVEPKARLKPVDLKQTFSTMARLKVDMLGKDMEYALEHKNKDIFDDRVLQPIRNILKTPAYYERTGRKPSWDTHIYDYPMNFRQTLIPLWYQYLESAFKTGLIDAKGVKARLKTFTELYEVDYRE